MEDTMVESGSGLGSAGFFLEFLSHSKLTSKPTRSKPDKTLYRLEKDVLTFDHLGLLS